ncbi:MAG: hypothetical protein KBD31_05315 [Proteobacteria bacterium]|nr:hypothetical protein [Pseudomonadota bacterium]
MLGLFVCGFVILSASSKEDTLNWKGDPQFKYFKQDNHHSKKLTDEESDHIVRYLQKDKNEASYRICKIKYNGNVQKTNVEERPIEPNNIVIEVYGGYDRNFDDSEGFGAMLCHCHDPVVENSLQVGVRLSDMSLPYRQKLQLTEKNLKNSHVTMLKEVSDVVALLKVKFPKTKFFLQGTSFGGFFVSSYALFQSVGLDELTYNDWGLLALKNVFGNDKIESVDGVISHAGGLYLLKEITKHDMPFTNWNVPILIHHNYDDHRVILYKQTGIYDRIPENYLYFLLSRFGASTLQNNPDIYSGYSLDDSLLGHTHNYRSQAEYDEAIRHFVDMVDRHKFGSNRTGFSKEQLKRRLKIASLSNYKTDEGEWLDALMKSGDGINHRDIEQFLSNTRDIVNDPSFKDFPQNLKIDKALKGITIIAKDGESDREAKQRIYNYLMNFASTKPMFKEAVKVIKRQDLKMQKSEINLRVDFPTMDAAENKLKSYIDHKASPYVTLDELKSFAKRLVDNLHTQNTWLIKKTLRDVEYKCHHLGKEFFKFFVEYAASLDNVHKNKSFAYALSLGNQWPQTNDLEEIDYLNELYIKVVCMIIPLSDQQADVIVNNALKVIGKDINDILRLKSSELVDFYEIMSLFIRLDDLKKVQLITDIYLKKFPNCEISIRKFDSLILYLKSISDFDAVVSTWMNLYDAREPFFFMQLVNLKNKNPERYNEIIEGALTYKKELLGKNTVNIDVGGLIHKKIYELWEPSR